MSSLMVIGNNGGDGERREEKKPAAHASSRKGCMKGKGGPENAFCTYKGVRQRTWGRWVSEIREPNRGSRLWLGTFTSAREAAVAYDTAARRLFGADAHLNLPDEAPPSPSRSTATRRAAELAAAAVEAKYNSVLLEMKMKKKFEKQIKMQMYMLMLHHQQQMQMKMKMKMQMQMKMEAQGGILGNVLDSESPFKKLNSMLPEFDDSAMWEEAASTMDYHSQAICDPGIAAYTFNDAIGIELKHPLLV
ncbi:dehydration-responsive element-binding protein 2D [Lactuca sativa]|uniref:dehydration-responsive element-binding protein 2D n=1 Tax=Lactuca sativa TaxID=4236 RepID=UPI000CAABE4B|nr:dehydration-responsive element-binding protein 2D [Lactuca sativa]